MLKGATQTFAYTAALSNYCPCSVYRLTSISLYILAAVFHVAHKIDFNQEEGSKHLSIVETTTVSVLLWLQQTKPVHEEMIGTNNSCLFSNCHFNLLVAIHAGLVIVIYSNFLLHN